MGPRRHDGRHDVLLGPREHDYQPDVADEAEEDAVICEAGDCPRVRQPPCAVPGADDAAQEYLNVRYASKLKDYEEAAFVEILPDYLGSARYYERGRPRPGASFYQTLSLEHGRH